MIDLIVVGAGPAGLFAGLRSAEKGASVMILEKNNKAGKKLLITGSGQCNLTNSAPPERFFNAYGNKERFVKPALLNYSNKALQLFFQEHGTPLTTREDGKVFPASQRSGDILETLLAGCRNFGATIHYNQPVTGIKKNNEGFTVITENRSWQGKNILLSCGGKSWPGTGSTGDGYRLAKELDHRIVEPEPALTPVYPRKWDGRDCSGIALRNIRIRLWRNGRKIGEHAGDILFTHKGLSGPGILDFSREFKVGDELRLCLTDAEDRQELDKRLISACSEFPKRSLKTILNRFGIPEALVLLILARCDINTETTGAGLVRIKRTDIVETLLGFSYVINHLGNFEEAMVTAGGVDTVQVNPKTMESRLVPGLFFAGEILDVDGDTGGFNLQFAFSSAELVSNRIQIGLSEIINSHYYGQHGIQR